MNKLLEQQKGQVESFRSIKNVIHQQTQLQKEQITAIKTTQENMQRDTSEQVYQLSDKMEYNSLKDKAFHNRKNIIILGLPEHEVQSAYSVAMRFFKSQLKLKKLDVEVAYRIRHPPAEDSTYIRPLAVKFYSVSHRNLVWKQHNNIPQPEDQHKTRIIIQADLPKQLRDDITTL